MADRAQVTSIEALESFRSSLLVYLSKARPVLDEVSADVQRTRNWLEVERRGFWEQQLKRRTEKLREAEQALFGARMSNFREATDAEAAAVRRAKQAVEEAENKLRRVKLWCRDFDSRVEPLAKQLDQLRNLYTIEMPKAAAHLALIMKALSDYAGLSAAPSVGASTTAPETAEAGGAPGAGGRS
jgi:predicted RNase H-like nuclease (RuvC/YqgF family)